MTKLIATRGLPGSGKSTWAKAEVAANPEKIKRVNKDTLREMLDSSHWSKTNERFVVDVRDFVIAQALSQGVSVIVDDTNFAEKHLRRFKELAKQHRAEFAVQDFTHVPLDQCIENDLKRFDSVGEQVIRKMYDRYLRVKPEPPTHAEGAPSAIIVDLDGTLALFDHHRGPYDASTCEDDIVCEPVVSVIRDFLDNEEEPRQVILMSGRESKYRPETERWLEHHCIPYEALHMRATGDGRKDFIVKRELYEAHVLGRYNVAYVIDDRNQVVDLWRSLGLVCFQVAEGNF